jgi:predicted RNase H-like HicB family nuclease
MCRERGGWTFRLDEVVRALPHLNPRSVRTHIVSRCCVNAPRHHPHRWEYFRRVARGTYEILPPHRRDRPGKPPTAAPPSTLVARRVDEGAPAYGVRRSGRTIDTVHAVIIRDRGWYVAECLEIAVVTQGRTLDELVANVRDAVRLHLEGEEAVALGVAAAPRIALTYEINPRAR